MRLGELIYYHRIQKNMTQEELAMGICSIPYLSKIENNKTEPSDEILHLLLERLGISNLHLHNQDKIEQCNQLLTEWYSVIKLRDKEKSSKLFNQILPLMNSIHDPYILNTYHLYLLRYHLLNDDLPSCDFVIDHLKKQQKNFSLEQEYYWHQFLGLYESMNNRLDEALMHYKNAEHIMKKLNINEADFLYQLAHLYTRFHQIANAFLYASSALERFNQEANLIKCVNCHIILGVNYVRINSYDQALNHYDSALRISEAIGQLSLKGTILHNMGYLYSKMGDHLKAITYYHYSLDAKDKLDHKTKANTIYYLANEFVSMKKYIEAEQYINMGLKMAEKENITDAKYKLLILKYKMNKTPPEEFLQSLEEEIIPYFLEQSDWSFLEEIAGIAAEHYLQTFQYKKASHYLSIQRDCLKKQII